ncbi:UDP-glycosyltransferase 82A1 [Juglans microcarpa x Juglans regia]|uniref:UDP-glycosyltransferase 82A1 n=1 Tax=Juglans microcarpa x Juglans regia TaxID=2249226 RepID=UPI001B7DCDD7|nr:UDP-glycosyltransferase 82A1 [Juglans microcarpa x Juglans regia]
MKCTKRPKIILVPYPAQGHVTPMLKLASAFHNRGFDTIMVTPEYIHHQIVSRLIESKDQTLSMPIPDGLDKATPRDFFAIEMAMEKNMPVHLEAMVRKLDEDGGVVCMVVDLLASWAIEVANRCRVPAAGFWPAMLATYRLIAAIPDLVRTGLISDAGIPQLLGTTCLPDQPMLSTEDVPWLVGSLAARKARFKFWTRTLDRSKTLRWLLVNSFPDEYMIDGKQTQLVKNSQDYHSPLVFPIGPLSKHAVSKNPSFWEEDKSCLDWLDKQKPDSVVYISFGSWVSPVGEGKVNNLALALEESGRPFIWVLGCAWREGLPVGYLQRVAMQGKVVSWAPQMEVLQHKAVGCYLTHCGWNSTMEAIQCQQRLLCYPVAGDQFVNCKYNVEVWGIGVKLNGFGQKDVAEGLRRVMDQDSEIWKNRLRRLYERTMGEEANSRVLSNLKAFIDDLKSITS